jgi:hypothetical protein
VLANLAALERSMAEHAASLPAAALTEMRGRITAMRARVTGRRAGADSAINARWAMFVWWFCFLYNGITLSSHRAVAEFCLWWAFLLWADVTWVAVKMAYMAPRAP